MARTVCSVVASAATLVVLAVTTCTNPSSTALVVMDMHHMFPPMLVVIGILAMVTLSPQECRTPACSVVAMAHTVCSVV